MIIKSITRSAGGNEVTLNGDAGEYCVITIGDARRLGFDKADDDDLPVEYSDDENLEFLSQKLKAIKYCSYLLQFSDKSEKVLREKMRQKDYSAEVCDAALEVLRESGITNDDLLCLRRMQAISRDKKYGPYRLKSELMSKGFSAEVIRRTEAQAEIDYEQTLRELIIKLSKGCVIDLDDTAALLKFKAKLTRYGYGFEHINSVLNTFEE